MVELTARITAATDRTHHLVQALHLLTRQARQQHGCTRACVAADLDEADAFWYREDWCDTGSFDAHLRSEHFSHLLALIETSTREPVLEIRTIGAVYGLEYVAAVRDPLDAP